MSNHVLPMLDRFMDGELPPRDLAGVAKHLADCPECRAEHDAAVQTRARLRQAARSFLPPANLRSGIESRLDAERKSKPRIWLPLAIAASVLAALGLNEAWQTDYLRLTPETQTAYVETVSRSLTPVMRVGFADHLHCTIFGKNFAQRFDLQEILKSLGLRNAQLYPALAKHIPEGYQVIEGHKCEVQGRRYLHLVARKGDHFISLLFTRRGSGEAFERDLRSVANETGIPLYASGAKRFQLAGFETSGFLVFLVSDLSADRNLSMLSTMSAELAGVADKLEL